MNLRGRCNEFIQWSTSYEEVVGAAWPAPDDERNVFAMQPQLEIASYTRGKLGGFARWVPPSLTDFWHFFDECFVFGSFPKNIGCW